MNSGKSSLNYWVLVTLITLLTACSSDEEKQQTNPAVTLNSSIDSKIETKINTLEEDIEQYGQVKITRLEESLFLGKPALAIHFSKPLDPLRSYQQWITVTNDRFRKVSGGWVLSEDGKSLYFTNVRSKNTYTLEVNSGLVAADKSRLKQGNSSKFTINNLTPVAGFSGKGMVIPAGTDAGLPVRSINVKSIQVDYFRVSADKLKFLMEEFDPASSGGEWRINRIMDGAVLVANEEYHLPNDANQRIETKLPLTNKITANPGVYFAVMNRSGSFRYQRPLTYFTVSDIGIHLRQYKNQWSVFTSSLDSGEANEKVQVRLLDSEGSVLSEGLTDSSGMINLAKQKKARLIIASKGEQLAVLNLSSPAMDISEFDLPSKVYQQREYFIYGPRDLYRPGEELDFSILLRGFDGQLIPSVAVVAELVSPDGTVLNTQLLSSQKNNYYHYRYQLSADAATGLWSLRVRLQDEKSSTSKSILVEDFLPERIKVSFSEQSAAMISLDKINQIKVKGDYLYGAPAVGNQFSATVNIAIARNPFVELKGFFFGDGSENSFRRFYTLKEQKLDANGEAALRLENYMIENIRQARGPVRLDYRASVFESGGRAVERALPLYSWQNGNWSGIKAEFNIDDNTLVNKQVSFQLVSVSSKGTPLANRNLSVTLVNLNRQAYWEYSDGDGWRYQQTDNPFTAWQQQFVSEDKPLRIQVPVEKGLYQIQVTEENGNLSTLDFKIGQVWWGRNKDNNGSRPDKITMTLNKPAYRQGDTVEVELQAPRPGKGFLIIENENGILTSQRISIGKDATTFSIKIGDSEQWNRHDLRLVSMIVQPEQQRRRGIPMRSIGIQPLPLDRSSKKIELTINAAEHVEPQKSFKVALKLNQQMDNQTRQPQQVFVTISAVDQGVLSVTDFKTPDPFKFFYQLRRPQVDARDNFSDILHVKDLAFAKQRYGGDAASLTRGGEKPASEVLIVSIFKGPVIINADGEAEVEFTMPDFNGAVRLMVAAYGADSFGSAETEVKVSSPVITQLSMPRFASIGDQTQLTLDIQNSLEDTQTIILNWDITGAEILTKSQISQTFKLSKNQKKMIKLPIQIIQATGTSLINLSLKSEKVDIKRKWILGLRPAYPSVTYQSLEALSQGESSTVESSWLDGKLAESLQLQFSLSPNPPLNTSEQWRSLLQYPYGCLEQTTSRARPLSVATEAVRKRWQVELPKNMDRVKAVQDAINRLQTMQRSEGGFGLWSNRSSEEYWLTSYVTEFLLSAKENGFQVPDLVLNRAINRLQDYVKSSRLSSIGRYYGNKIHYRFAYRSYAALILSKQGKAPLGTLRQWLDQYQNESQSALPLIHLAVALKLQGDRKRSNKAVAMAAKIIRKKRQYLGDYGSEIRDEAMILALNHKYQLNLIDPDKRLLNLSELIYRRYYLSTQERDAILQLSLALDESDQNNPWSAKLKVAANSKSIQGPGDWSQVIKGEKAAFSSIEISGEKKIYLSKTLIANSSEPPEASFHGYNVKREWFDTSGNPFNSQTIKTGDYIIVRLQVHAEKRSPDTMIVDLIPAGFELENPGLKHSTPIESFSVNGKRLTEVNPNYGPRIKHKEYRDDRYVAAVDLYGNSTLELVYLMRAVTPGTYQVPSAFVEDMYRPENRGVGYPFKAVTVISK